MGTVGVSRTGVGTLAVVVARTSDAMETVRDAGSVFGRSPEVTDCWP
jgi:hypothetical protein